jgi:hypothetical protein
VLGGQKDLLVAQPAPLPARARSIRAHHERGHHEREDDHVPDGHHRQSFRIRFIFRCDHFFFLSGLSRELRD